MQNNEGIGPVRRFFADPSWRSSPMVAGIVVALVASLIGLPVAQCAGGDDTPPNRTEAVPAHQTVPAPTAAPVTTTGQVAPTSSTTEYVPSDTDPLNRFVGGCGRFHVYEQGRYATPGYGAALRVDPFPSAPRVDLDPSTERMDGSASNTIIPVNGWVATEAPYLTNPDPWDSDVWFHLTNGTGWVSFAGVRAEPSSPEGTDGPEGGRTTSRVAPRM